jgi:AraC-like DNA-binding protein
MGFINVRLFFMPIYMDRHDVSKTVTAENVAELHQKDLAIQDRFACRGLTYWFDDKRKTAFCLIEAPDEKAIVEMHNYAHGEVPHRVIEVDPLVVESFLGRIEDPVKAQDTELNIIDDPAFRYLMVISLKLLSLSPTDSTRFKLASNHFNQLVPEILHHYHGKPVNHTNNHYLISFHSVSHAVHAAFEIQKGFAGFRDGIDSDKLHLKIGLSSGVPVTEKSQLFEDAIKLAERMSMIIQADIIVSSEVAELFKAENPDLLEESEVLYRMTPADEQFINQLMDYTETSWSNIDLKVDDFNKPVGYSKSQLYRKMILLTGKSPNEFIKEYRLNEALALMNKNAGNVSEIAYETGFSSPSYFAKCFYKKYGYSPSDYLSGRAN